ncbi:MAG: hypothetical protein MZU91_01905 [Desulfosudis oleivorans]|nr:hypothetical protein [Desulfosudis oleivorans]
MNGIFNPKQKAQEELIKLELVRDAETKSKDELFDLRMKILQELDPFESEGGGIATAPSGAQPAGNGKIHRRKNLNCLSFSFSQSSKLERRAK